MAERAGEEGDGPELSRLSGASNVLVLVSSLGDRGRNACFELLTRTQPSETNVLTVTYTDTAPEFVAHWNDYVGAAPVRGGVVAVGQGGAEAGDPSWVAKSVDNPADLTGIGIELSELLSTMSTAADDGEQLAFCFDSITSLLQYADLQRAFRFLHVVTGRVKTADGVGYYRLDPEAHDAQALATLKGLFDAVVEVDENGEWTIQR